MSSALLSDRAAAVICVASSSHTKAIGVTPHICSASDRSDENIKRHVNARRHTRHDSHVMRDLNTYKRD
jgi:hypothetical protein